MIKPLFFAFAVALNAPFATAAVEREMNFDETKVRPYALEDPLVHADGRKVTRVSWPERRRELLDVMDRELFGREPPLPEALEVELATNEVVTLISSAVDSTRSAVA